MKTNGNLVDTNIVSKLMNGDIAVIEIFDKLDNIHVSSITAGELFYGAFKSKRKVGYWFRIGNFCKSAF